MMNTAFFTALMAAIGSLLVTLIASRLFELVLRRKGQRAEVDVMDALNRLEHYRFLKMLGRDSTRAHDDVIAKAMNFVMGVQSEAKAMEFISRLSAALGEEDRPFIDVARRIIARRFSAERESSSENQRTSVDG